MKIQNIAHRGFSGKYPENTMISFKKAAELQADMIELDVTISLDRIPVVIHDDTLERTTGEEGIVSNFTYEQLKKLDAGTWMNKKFNREKIPSLKEVLVWIKNKKIQLNIEIKDSAFEKEYHKDGIEKQVLELIEKYSIADKCIISSFNHRILERIRRLSSAIRISYLYNKKDKPEEGEILFCRRMKVYSLNISSKELKKKIFKKAVKEGIPVFVYTVNSKKEMRAVLKKGVMGIFTNYPDKLSAILNKKARF